MKLTYRGVDYDYNPTSLELTEQEIVGRYRGQAVTFKYVRHVPVPQPAHHLTYRGVPYSTNTQGQVQPAAQPASESIFAKLTAANRPINPMADARLNMLRSAATVHRDNIQRSLQHRMEVARNQGNERLLHQLEEEMHRFA